MALIDFGGVKEEVVTRDEFPMAKALEILKDETIAVIGYGVQGPAQALNMKDNGFCRSIRALTALSAANRFFCRLICRPPAVAVRPSDKQPQLHCWPYCAAC